MDQKPIYQIAIIVLIVILAALIFLPSSPPQKYLFVVNAASGSFNDTFTLKTESIIIFSDRPERFASQMSLDEFLALWPDNFEQTPPNAEFSIAQGNAVVELMNARQGPDGIMFSVKILEGSIPSEFNSASLFIDDVQSSDSIENFVGQINVTISHTTGGNGGGQPYTPWSVKDVDDDDTATPAPDTDGDTDTDYNDSDAESQDKIGLAG